MTLQTILENFSLAQGRLSIDVVIIVLFIIGSLALTFLVLYNSKFR